MLMLLLVRQLQVWVKGVNMAAVGKSTISALHGWPGYSSNLPGAADVASLPLLLGGLPVPCLQAVAASGS